MNKALITTGILLVLVLFTNCSSDEPEPVAVSADSTGTGAQPTTSSEPKTDISISTEDVTSVELEKPKEPLPPPAALQIVADPPIEEEVAPVDTMMIKYGITFTYFLEFRSFINRGTLDICPHDDWSKENCNFHDVTECLDLTVHPSFKGCAEKIARSHNPYIVECRKVDWNKTGGYYEVRCLF